MSETMTAPAGADDAWELVAAALDALERRTPFIGENEVSTLPEVLAITSAPDGVRRHCILLATYHDRIEAYPDEHRIHWHAALRMLAVIARTPVGLTADDIELLLP